MESKIKLDVEGQEVEINDLGQTMNEAFRQLFSSFFSSPALNFEKFEKVAIDFFNSVENDAALSKLQKASCHDKFFFNFTIIWQWLLKQGRIGDAEYLWERAVDIAHSWENQNRDSFIHKGAAFYFWGATVNLTGNLDKGYLLMHQALKEDIRTHSKPTPPTPSLAFARPDYTKPKQTFRELIELPAELLEELLDKYRPSYGKHLTLEELHRRFIQDNSDSRLLSLFAYTLARLYNFEKAPRYLKESDFAGQLGMNLLTDLALVIEATIKQKSRLGEGTLGNQINDYLLQEPQINHEFTGWNNNTLKQLREDKSNPDAIFERTLNELLSPDPFRFDDESELTTFAGKDLALTYMIRNRGAHNVSPIKTIWERFTELRQSLFNVLFLCVETLYP